MLRSCPSPTINDITTDSATQSLSVCYNDHFPGEPGLASFIGDKDDGGSGDN